MLNKVFLMGRLVRDPELRQTPSGVQVCRFSIAVDRPYKNQQTGERECDFIECSAWRQTAEFVSRYFTKGKMILVEGAMRNNNYVDSNGVQHYAMQVQVDSVSFCGKSESDAAPAPAPQTAPAQAPAHTPAAVSGMPQPTQMSLDDLAEFEELVGSGEDPF